MSSTYQLSLDEVHRALDELDPVALVTAELTGRAAPAPSYVAAAQTPTWQSADCGEPQAAVEDPATAARFVLPLRALQAARSASLAAAAARLLVPPGAATVSVLGSGLPAELALRIIARYVTGATHIAVCPAGGRQRTPSPAG